MDTRVAVESTAEALLYLLKARGVEYLFANAGTDFAPIVEAYAKLQASGQLVARRPWSCRMSSSPSAWPMDTP